MPPPKPLRTDPLLILSPSIVTVWPSITWKMRKDAFAARDTARRSAPGPLMVMFLLITSSPLVRPIAPVTANVIVSPSLAPASASRSEPGPLSLVLVTTGPCGWTSNEPLSIRPFTTRLKPGPRWSKKGGGVKFGSPASIAGLLGNSACVNVGPPLSCKGPSSGAVLIWSPGPVKKPPASSSLRL